MIYKLNEILEEIVIELVTKWRNEKESEEFFKSILEERKEKGNEMSRNI